MHQFVLTFHIFPRKRHRASPNFINIKENDKLRKNYYSYEKQTNSLMEYKKYKILHLNIIHSLNVN